ncbi:hypothetical protein V8E36_003975 [Tilletia maclaganii]
MAQVDVAGPSELRPAGTKVRCTCWNKCTEHGHRPRGRKIAARTRLEHERSDIAIHANWPNGSRAGPPSLLVDAFARHRRRRETDRIVGVKLRSKKRTAPELAGTPPPPEPDPSGTNARSAASEPGSPHGPGHSMGGEDDEAKDAPGSQTDGGGTEPQITPPPSHSSGGVSSDFEDPLNLDDELDRLFMRRASRNYEVDSHSDEDDSSDRSQSQDGREQADTAGSASSTGLAQPGDDIDEAFIGSGLYRELIDAHTSSTPKFNPSSRLTSLTEQEQLSLTH